MKLTFGIALLAVLFISVTSAGHRKTSGGHRKKLLAQIAELTNAVKQLNQKKEGTGPWLKLNTDPVCFGAKDSQFGTFKVPSGGNIRHLKLVHLYGYVSCAGGSINYWSPFSCSIYPGISDYVGVTVTTAGNTVLLPPKELSLSSGWSFIPGFDGQSREVVFTKFSDPVTVTSGQELRLWYSEDLKNGPEFDNGGKSCCDVYAIFE